jgi:ABC-type uncharacterized transport system substrate-binding protein
MMLAILIIFADDSTAVLKGKTAAIYVNYHLNGRETPYICNV